MNKSNDYREGGVKNSNLGRMLFDSRQTCLNSFVKYFPFLLVWINRMIADFRPENVNEYFNTVDRYNSERISVAVARETLLNRLRAFRAEVARFVDSGESPSLQDCLRIRATFLGFDPRFDMLRVFVTRSGAEAPLEIRRAFSDYDSVRNEVMEENKYLIIGVCKGKLPSEIYREDKRDAFSNAREIALDSLDRFTPNKGADVSTYLYRTVEMGTITFLNKLWKNKAISIDKQTDSGTPYSSLIADRRVDDPYEIAATNERDKLLIRRLREHLNEPHVSMYLEYLTGVEEEAITAENLERIIKSSPQKKSYAQFVEKKAVLLGHKPTPQAIQQFCQKGRDILQKILCDLV